MTEIDQPRREPRKLGALFSRSLELAVGTAGTNAAIWAAGMLPGFLVIGVLAALGLAPDEAKMKAAIAAGNYGPGALMLAVSLLDKAFMALAVIAMVLTLDGYDQGRPTSAGEALGASLDVWWRLVFTECLAFLFIIIGLLCLIIPGILLSVRYSLLHAAVILEGRSGRDALARSKQLMIAKMSKVIGNLLAIFIPTLLLCAAVSFILGIGRGFLPNVLPLNLLGGFADHLATRILLTGSSAMTVLLFRDLAAAQEPS